jgi:hypothetical protein
MNTRTRSEIISLLENLRELSLRLTFGYAAETADSCTNVIEALNQDDTITETK